MAHDRDHDQEHVEIPAGEVAGLLPDLKGRVLALNRYPRSARYGMMQAILAETVCMARTRIKMTPADLFNLLIGEARKLLPEVAIKDHPQLFTGG